MTLPSSLLIALGGNAIVKPGEAGTVAQQFARTRDSMAVLARALAAETTPPRLLDHARQRAAGGRRSLARRAGAHRGMGPIPLDAAVADTQGFMGSMIARLLRDELDRLGSAREVAAVVTHVVVDPEDPAFADPSKPVGAFYPSLLQARRPGWIVKEFAPRGWRRVVPSPRPLAVVERATIEALFRSGTIVIAAGGGGVPVARGADGRLHGVEAVVDKDFTSALLGGDLGVETLAILTGVERVYVDWATPRARALERVTAGELAKLQAQGQFPEGSMGPKVSAALEFLARGGKRVVITAEDKLVPGLEGSTGTWVVA